uniref:Protein kinase domain-containing protein n=1 Tax=Fagus sylvatica TaxID=28930 RepID=A0A2N9FCH7_FAGSY
MSKYELGRTLGEGNFGKVKFAKNIETGQSFAVKILEKNKIIHLNITDQVVLTATHLAIVMEYAAGGDSLFCIQLYPNQVLASGQRMLGDGVMP